MSQPYTFFIFGKVRKSLKEIKHKNRQTEVQTDSQKERRNRQKKNYKQTVKNRKKRTDRHTYGPTDKIQNKLI